MTVSKKRRTPTLAQRHLRGECPGDCMICGREKDAQCYNPNPSGHLAAVSSQRFHAAREAGARGALGS